MSFDKAGNFLLLAAKKYKLGDQVTASIIRERIRNIFKENYRQFADLWNPQKFENGILTIACKNAAASSELFLRTNELLEIFATYDFPEKITEIRIVKNISRPKDH